MFLFFLVFIICYLVIALSKSFLLKSLNNLGFVQFIREEGPKSHQSKKFTPTAGGLIFLTCVPIVFLINYIYLFIYKNNINLKILFSESIILIFSALIGFADDYLKKVKKQNEGLKPKHKLLGQLVLTFISVLFLQRQNTNIFGQEINLGIFIFFIFVFLVLAGTMNASNLTDGLDGLACSVMGFSFLGLSGLIYLLNFNYESIFWSLGLSGICFGFLWINFYPAKAFMGDTGSLLLGASLAQLALLNNLEWYLLLICIIPLLETVSVILQILSSKLSKRFYKKDLRLFKMSPFHHHLELSGWSEKKIIFYFCLIQFIFCLLTIVFVFIFNK